MPPHLRLGSHRHDLDYGALVVANLDRQFGAAAVARGADSAATDGADVLAVARRPEGHAGPVGEGQEADTVAGAVESLTARFDLPVAVETDRVEVLRAAAKTGAVAAIDPSGSTDPAYLSTAADLGLTVVVRAAVGAGPSSASARASSAGLRPDEVVLDASIAQVGPLAAAGHPVMLTEVEADPEAALAMAALAITRGARLVRTANVAATVRVVRMLERIMSG